MFEFEMIHYHLFSFFHIQQNTLSLILIKDSVKIEEDILHPELVLELI